MKENATKNVNRIIIAGNPMNSCPFSKENNYLNKEHFNSITSNRSRYLVKCR